MTRRLISASAATVAVLAIGAGVAEADTHAKEGIVNGNNTLAGVWTVTVDPRPTPAGDQPPFESTLAYGPAQVVNEITSRAGVTSAGLGTWERVGGETYRTTWHKYRFDATGAYVGRTQVTEEITVTGPRTYSAHALTRVLTAGGAVVAQFESDAQGVRMP